MKTFESFAELETRVISLKTKKGTETWIKEEILGYLDQQKTEPEYWDNPMSLLWNIADETHDGAYTKKEDPEKYWDDDDFEKFANKYLS